MSNQFRILSLSGGGIRGIYQAGILKKIAPSLQTPLHSNFDLICGTSTGSIIAFAIALNIDIEKVYDLYEKKGSLLFEKKIMWWLRKGPMYKQSLLKKFLEEIFYDKKLGDCTSKILITASCINKVKYRIFRSFDADPGDLNLKIVDIILSSTAAPFYFEPMQPHRHDGIYLDGGLWANSPSTVALQAVHSMLHIPYSKIKLLAIGTCEFPIMEEKHILKNLKKIYIISHLKKILEMSFAAQESYDDYHVRSILKESNYLKINSTLNEYMAMDDYESALKKLPGLATQEIDINKEHAIKKLLKDDADIEDYFKIRKRHELVSEELIEETGLSGFFPSRDFYAKRHSDTMEKYIETSKHSLVFVSISMHKGGDFENLREVLRKKIIADGNFTINISLLNPNKDYLMESIAYVFEKDKTTLANEIKQTASMLINFKSSLKKSKYKKRLNLTYHNSIPFGSAIIFDKDTEDAKIQIETKAYKSVQNKSFAFEIIPVKKDGLYFTLVKGFSDLIADGEQMKN